MYNNLQEFPTFETPPFKFTLELVHGQLQYLDCRKAVGVDNVYSRLLSDAAHIVAASLTNIMSNSLKPETIHWTGKKPILHLFSNLEVLRRH